MTVSFGHHMLQNRYRFQATLRLETPLRLSSGRASDATDAPLMRDRAGIPYIPGSSLRGALRAEIERILAAAGPLLQVRSCTLFTEDTSPEACISINRAKQEKVTECSEEDALQFVEQHLCDVCKLFGSTVYASGLVIEDSYPQDQAAWRSKSVVRDGVGIDRDTGTARDTAKFDYEVLETGPVFTLRMQVENVTASDKRVLNLMLGLLKQGVYVGGKRAAGLGKILLHTWPVTVTGFHSAHDLWQAIMAGKDPHQPLTWEGETTC